MALRQSTVFAVFAVAAGGIGMWASFSAGTPTAPDGGSAATVTAVTADGSHIVSELLGRDGSSVAADVTPALRPTATGLRSGQRVWIATSGTSNAPKIVTLLRPVESRLPLSFRIWLFFTSILVVPVLAVLLTLGAPTKLIEGKDKRYSNSKTQAFAWFTLVVGAYVGTVLVRCLAWGTIPNSQVQIPVNLMLLSGMSALTFVGAKWVTTAQVQPARAAAADLVRKRALVTGAVGAGVADDANRAADIAERGVKRPAEAPRPGDLVQDDEGNVDFADFQMLVVTLIAIVAYGLRLLDFWSAVAWTPLVSLPDVDTTILALFGVGQGAYLTKKIASDKA
jgi:hypothetical protein